MKRAILLATLLFLIAIAKAQTNYYISLSGDDNNTGLSEAQAWRSIAFAVSASSPVAAGDHVHIKAGNYGNENIVVDKTGTAALPIIFEGYQTTPGDNPDLNYTFGDPLDASVMPLLDGGNRASGDCIDLSGASYFHLKNIQITNYQSGVYTWASSSTHLLIENIIIMSIGDINHTYSGLGIGIVYGDYNTVRNCIVVNSCAEGISIVADHTLVENCQVYCNEDMTEHASMDYYIVVSEANNNHIKDCYIERIGDIEHGGAGIGTKGNAQNNLFENCVAKDLENGCFLVRHSGTKYNEFRNCKAIGTLADVNGFLVRDGASYNEFNDCVSENCSSAIRFAVSGEDADYCGRFNTFNNCIIKNATWAIEFSSWAIAGVADENLFANCVFDNANYLFESARENHDNRMVNCIIKDMDNLVTGSETLNFAYTYSDFYDNGFAMPSGTGNISTDPQFLDAANGDYHLLGSSPCIDNGTSTDAPSKDFEGTSRPQGAGYDIGSYEYLSPLSVEYYSPLRAKIQGQKILLEWTSTVEINNDYFQIERSIDGKIWKIIAQTKGQGNSHKHLNYKVFDDSHPSGKLYYRLKQVDFDGLFSYSNLVSVFFAKADFKMSPSPTTGLLDIHFSKRLEGDISVMDMNGRQVIQQKIVGANMKLNLSHLPNGVYQVSLRTKRMSINKQVVLRK